MDAERERDEEAGAGAELEPSMGTDDDNDDGVSGLVDVTPTVDVPEFDSEFEVLALAVLVVVEPPSSPAMPPAV